MPEVFDPDNLDLIWGADAIAAAINKSRRQTFYLLEGGLIPAKKIGRQWCAQRSQLREHFSKVFEGEAA